MQRGYGAWVRSGTSKWESWFWNGISFNPPCPTPSSCNAELHCHICATWGVVLFWRPRRHVGIAALLHPFVPFLLPLSCWVWWMSECTQSHHPYLNVQSLHSHPGGFSSFFLICSGLFVCPSVCLEIPDLLGPALCAPSYLAVQISGPNSPNP